ncbi:MAG: UbiH/UbiF/VisC/COQ6 family ubiquinone biosynthesis hydroxylase [Gammaproteobacteria bacterium]|nr:UbiH/UbiF/VisC/COQ6 family ubiquinone biosynthesis hydroxylase [Gammaproteobacteria bacterium]MCZ6717139.1 UbiH/UbiF/VisC/COQ6 family ubiquinone biosynthesis hydroxylase [Gammaproteobacteria bacterium]MCZ6826066.1 UbiH/UbiF/VisC/COQ6 family ubiquinone biosynthesis hydroxylase [Gammaproteobacteria bacterium]MCZ6912163.1 UbiH/UbiF/VisC/COQ6 family ubiquinone biosynthesis hydroxylase [Pseudomonadota bacterium]
MNAPTICIVGGGMVGCALAALFGRDQRYTGSVVLLEAGDPPTLAAGYDLRVVALSATSQRVLEAAGAWPEIAATRVSPYREMQVWDADSKPGLPGSVHFSAAEVGAAALGHIVENQLIRHTLWQSLAGLERVVVRPNSRVADLRLDDDKARLSLDNGEVMDCTLVVAADGAASPIRDMAGIETTGWSYRQKAVVTHVQSELPHRETAWQRFLPSGPLAFLPLADGRSSVVWSNTVDGADRLLDLKDTEFLAELETASDGTLGRMLECSRRAAFPLRLLHARDYCRQRLVLIGDAAHAIHPLAGQGVNLGFLDAAALHETLVKALQAGEDTGDRSVLRRYERWRKGDNLVMLAAMDGIKRLFSNDLKSLARIRGFGLSLVNALPPARKAFVRRAMGMTGDLPELLSKPKRPEHGFGEEIR